MKSERSEILKRYRDKNKEILKLKSKEYKESNKEKIALSNKEYKLKNRNDILEKSKEYHNKNKDKEKIYRNKYRNERKKTDLSYNLSEKIRTKIYRSLKQNGYTKKSRTFEILGCSYDEFKLHLENQFESWMTWNNYGKYNGELNYGWDIDHIIPQSTGQTEEEILKLNHYLNLRPLCSYINRIVKKDNPDY